MDIPVLPTPISILCCIYQRIDSWNHHSLAAPYWRVYWNRRQNWSLRLGASIVALDPDRLILMPPDTPATATSSGSADHLYIHFTMPWPFERMKPALFEIHVDTHARTLIHHLIAPKAHSPIASFIACQLCYLALSGLPSDRLLIPSHSDMIRTAIDTIGSTLCDPVDNTVLARMAGMNTNAFIRRFKQETGLTPQAWSLARRIEHACSLLHHSGKSIKEIADETGFCDRHHFSHAFKAIRHLGPAEFREQRIY